MAWMRSAWAIGFHVGVAGGAGIANSCERLTKSLLAYESVPCIRILLEEFVKGTDESVAATKDSRKAAKFGTGANWSSLL